MYTPTYEWSNWLKVGTHATGMLVAARNHRIRLNALSFLAQNAGVRNNRV